MLNRLLRKEKLDRGVRKTRAGFFGKVRTLLTAERPIDEDLWDELEELLLQADVGVQLTDQLLQRLRDEQRAGEIESSRDLFDALQDAMATALEEVRSPNGLVSRGSLTAVLVVGVNGVGKTTSIAKLGSFGVTRATTSCWRRLTRSTPRRSTSSRSGASGRDCR